MFAEDGQELRTTHVTLTSAQYNRLIRDQNWLNCLEAAGVDNWDGYSVAFEIARERNLDVDDTDGDDE
jgi:hypothetical protein